MCSLTFLFLILTAAYTAMSLDHAGTPLDGFLFSGIVSGLFALLGVIIGVADETLAKRLGIGLIGALGLCGVFLLHPQFDAWGLLLSICRLVLMGTVFLWVRHRRNVVFSNRPGSPACEWGKLRLLHLFGFTLIVALFLSLVRILKQYDGSGGDAWLIVVVVSFGVFAAMVPLFSAIATIGRPDIVSAIPCVLAILTLAMCMGFFAYSQTDSWRMGIRFSLKSILEASTVAGALLALRLRGYYLASIRADSTIDIAEETASHGVTMAGRLAANICFPPCDDP